MVEIRRLIPLALVVVAAASCGGNDKKSSATPAQPPGPTTTRSGDEVPGPTSPISTTPAPPKSKAAPSKGKAAHGSSLLMEKRDLYPLLTKSVARYAPTQVTGKNVKVIALAGSESFWAGRSASERILVHIRLKGSSAPPVKVGQKGDLIGQLTMASANAAATLGVKDAAGSATLQREGAYLEVSIGDLHLK
jgi:hypothetical protein